MASLRALHAGTYKVPTAVRVNRAGAWVEPLSVSQRIAGAWTKVWAALPAFYLSLGTRQEAIIGSSLRIRQPILSTPDAGNSYAWSIIEDSWGDTTLTGNVAQRFVSTLEPSMSTVTVQCIVTGPNAGTYTITFEIGN